ncbi:hypothetical protein ACJMK2_041415 [Sinanodonta woodiana]|uniref:Coiled-coil-helix-coiled-coil-helix domain-containing protein 7 n=1 Tax=Sinanodonta woodiana TaxID=1069815 RepID=A0ABD3W421_SINWO
MPPNNTTPLTAEDNKKRVKGNVLDREKNPCLREHNMSLKCLNDNYFDKTKCEAYFENYRRCKKFWGKIEMERRWKGIKPAMPSYDEREEILRQHQANKSS